MLWLLTELLLSPLALFSIVLILLYYYGTHTYGFWKIRGIPYIKPKFPFLGNFYDTMFSLKCNHIKQQEIYNYFSGERFVGAFALTEPTLFIRDPTLVESVLIKDFTSFYNRGSGVNVKTEPLATNLVNLEDMQWKSLRQKLTPAFTSGKLKSMHHQLVECSDELVKYLEDYLQKSEPIEIRDAMANFTTDVIGSCAFGLSVNSLKNPDSEFRKIGKKMFEASIRNKLRFIISNQHPSLQRIMAFFQKFSKRATYFINVIQNTIAYREKNNVVRNDFMQLLMELKKQDMEKQKNGILKNDREIIFDDNVVAANAVVFFFAGFDTTATTLSYCLYELSLNQDIQEEAYLQIVDVLNKYGGEITYEAVNEMKLIHQIFNETLRLHPPAVQVRRKASKNYTVPGTSLTLPKDTLIIIPIYSLQHDPEYFPEPEKFKPERFSNEKENIKKGTYMPFGDGPRICIVIVDDNVVAANANMFFFAGFETIAITLTYCLYELSLNLDIQEEAYLQIVDVLDKYGGEITYEAVKEMKLIHQIFNETLRLYPPAVNVRRKASKNYTVPGTTLTLPKDTLIIIPIYSLQRDPEYFPDPEKFKPERFSNEKENIKKGTYIPFGDGPRSCIGERFAKMEIHVALAKLLLNYKFTLNSKTISPLVYNPASFLSVPIGGIWLDIHKRI